MVDSQQTSTVAKKHNLFELEFAQARVGGFVRERVKPKSEAPSGASASGNCESTEFDIDRLTCDAVEASEY